MQWKIIQLEAAYAEQEKQTNKLKDERDMLMQQSLDNQEFSCTRCTEGTVCAVVASEGDAGRKSKRESPINDKGGDSIHWFSNHGATIIST